MCGAPTRRDGRGDDWSTSRVRASSGRRRAQWIVHGYAIDATRQPSTLGLQGCSLMMVCSTECSTSARVCCRSCAARRPRRRSQTRQRRGAAPETALSSAVSSQAQRHQVWCKTPRATGSPPPTPPTLQTIRADVRKGGTKTVRGHNRKCPSHDKQPGSTAPHYPKTTQK